MIGGGLMLLLALYGLTLAGYQLVKGYVLERRRSLVILLLATLFQFTALLLFNPLPIQRYYVPLIPFHSLWASYGIVEIAREIIKATRSRGSLIDLLRSRFYSRR